MPVDAKEGLRHLQASQLAGSKHLSKMRKRTPSSSPAPASRSFSRRNMVAPQLIRITVRSSCSTASEHNRRIEGQGVRLSPPLPHDVGCCVGLTPYDCRMGMVAKYIATRRQACKPGACVQWQMHANSTLQAPAPAHIPLEETDAALDNRVIRMHWVGAVLHVRSMQDVLHTKGTQ